MLPENIYDVAAVRSIERIAFTDEESKYNLMQRAASDALYFTKLRWPDTRAMVIYAGTGNNGGDGYCFARFAKEQGIEVYLYLVGDVHDLQDTALNAYRDCCNIGVRPINWQQDGTHKDIYKQVSEYRNCLIIDAIFGIGLNKELNEYHKSAILAINKWRYPVVAIDIPSGLNASTGSLLPIAVKADLTVTFVRLKPGLLTGKARDITGEIICADLGLADNSEIFPYAKLLKLAREISLLKPRPNNAHKGMYGPVAIIGSNYGMYGASVISGLAALRSGAGLVKICLHESNYPVKSAPEIMSIPCDSNNINDVTRGSKVLVIGPGLGQDDWAKNILTNVKINVPCVLDADALNLLSTGIRIDAKNLILTPHPKEAARLLGISVEEIESNRYTAIKKLSSKYNAHVVLKGSGTLACYKDDIRVCRYGNPGMATAGMGDILSGLIGSLIAQDIPINDAINLAVVVHAQAGDSCCEKGSKGMIATDLLLKIREILG